ncbi:unnamed protein product [Notodromas monacha]|uniref:Uncharacterized protein n=1 Tax=Notodromas monacha TaxID=399045 RepID=A0A7R9BG41_9CRUS|nr:unnamed protein product [Notodromas monacha]CAG0913989.1 unnamed protein product [Notodromas monacha]
MIQCREALAEVLWNSYADAPIDAMKHLYNEMFLNYKTELAAIVSAIPDEILQLTQDEVDKKYGADFFSGGLSRMKEVLATFPSTNQHKNVRDSTLMPPPPSIISGSSTRSRGKTPKVLATPSIQGGSGLKIFPTPNAKRGIQKGEQVFSARGSLLGIAEEEEECDENNPAPMRAVRKPARK